MYVATWHRDLILPASISGNSQHHQGHHQTILGRNCAYSVFSRLERYTTLLFNTNLLGIRERWRYTGPFTRFNRFRGTFPGFGIAAIAFATYCGFEYLFLKDDHHDQHGASHGAKH